MSFQLSFDGFPVPLIREAYTAPKPVSSLPNYPVANPTPILKMSLNAVSYTLFNDFSEFSKKRNLMQRQAALPLVRIRDTGTLSKSAMSRMRRAINYLFLVSPIQTCFNDDKGYFYTMRNNFITLTLSGKQSHSDNEIKKILLKPFLDVLIKRYPSIQWVWKAEPQRNGNIHFHIITNHFIPKSYVNRVWNRIQRRHGYLDKYHAKHGHWNPPSTETRKVKGKERSANYMLKYMIKDYGTQTLEEAKIELRSIMETISITVKPHLLAKLETALQTVQNKIDYLSRRKIKGKLWGANERLLLKPFTCIAEGLGQENEENIFSQECVSESEYYQTFVPLSFADFIAGFGHELRTEIRFYFRLLVPPKPIPKIVFHTNSNYSY